MNSKYALIDQGTGEIIVENYPVYKKYLSKDEYKKNKLIIDSIMVKDIKDITEDEIQQLQKWCCDLKEINKYKYIKIYSPIRSIEFEKFLIKHEDILIYIFKLFLCTNKYSCCVKVNHNIFVNTWTKLYEAIGISSNNIRMQQKIKRFVLDNNILRIYKTKDKIDTRFIVNPFLYRNSQYVKDIAVIVFKDFINSGDNISQYVVKLLDIKKHLT